MNKKGFQQIRNIFLYVLMAVVCMTMIFTKGTIVHAAEIGEARIVVDSFTVTEDSVAPGQEFELSLTLKNTSNTYSASNVLVSFETPSKAILPVYGTSNQVYIDTIPAGTNATATFDLIVDSNVDVEYLEAVVTISSYDGSGAGKSTNYSTVRIPLQLRGTLVLSSYAVPENSKVGTKSRVSATYFNSGMEELSNIQILITGDGLSRDYGASLGDLGPGESNIAEIYLDFVTPGTQNLYMNFQYTDADGEVHSTVSENFIVDVEEPVSGQDGITVVDNSLGLGSMIQFILLGAIVILGIVVAVLIRSNRSK